MPWERDDEIEDWPWLDPETRTTVVGHVGAEREFRIDVMPMIFNDRVVVQHRDDYPSFIAAGFCYDKGIPAVLAALEWVSNWDEMDVPNGFKKEAINLLSEYGKGTRK